MGDKKYQYINCVACKGEPLNLSYNVVNNYLHLRDVVRSGEDVTLRFWCEQCWKESFIEFKQHKGTTETTTYFVDKKIDVKDVF